MLNNYHLFNKYNQLWAKYGDKPSINASLLISNEEDSIKWSIKLRETISIIAKESDRQENDLIDLFINKLEKYNGNDKLKIGLSAIGDPQEIIDRFQLFFDFNSLDDLFLDKNKEIGVISIE